LLKEPESCGSAISAVKLQKEEFMDQGRLQNRVALITGGARGIGKATAFKMVREGASVALLDIFSDEAARVAQDLEALGGKALGLKADVSRKDEVDRAVERALQHFGRVDILVNNAGIVRPAPLEKVREEDWDAAVSVNLKGTFFVPRQLSRR